MSKGKGGWFGHSKEHGMAAMAILSEPKVRELIDSGKNVVIDDLMSWQELLWGLLSRFRYFFRFTSFTTTSIAVGKRKTSWKSEGSIDKSSHNF